jgi:hypothetical protein
MNDMKKNGLPVAYLVGLTLLATEFGVFHSSRAADLVIDVFSGRPNPTLTLTESEVAQVQRLLGEATPAPAKDPATVYPNLLGYRGVEIHPWETNQTAGAVLRIRAPDILLLSSAGQNWFRAQDTTLERYLVNLAHESGAIDDELYRYIRLDIEKRSPDTLFLDDFNGPTLNPLWSAPLPSTANSMPPILMSYAGSPYFAFEKLGAADSILRLSNQLAPVQRRGWACATNFSASEFRYQARFNTLKQGPPASTDGFIELWILDAADVNRFIFVSLFEGSLDFAPVTFSAASSFAAGDRAAHAWWTSAQQTYYRLVLEGSHMRPWRALLLTDDGREILSHTFQNTAAAFPSGFRIGLSQSRGSDSWFELAATDVAVDFLQLTGTSTANPTEPVLMNAGISGRMFQFSMPTAPGKTYVIESNDVLGGTNWTRLPPFAGDGTIWRVAVPAGSTRQFFRLRVE